MGIHRCLGSHLARMIFDIVMTEVLARMPDCSIVEGESVRYPDLGPSTVGCTSRRRSHPDRVAADRCGCHHTTRPPR